MGKELRCTISISGKYSNVPQVAPRMTREGPYLYCHLSYTGRSEGDASTEVIASFYCIDTQTSRRNKIYSHRSSIFTEKKSQKEQVTKLEMKGSLNHEPEQVHTRKRRKKMKIFPKTYRQMFIVLHIYNRIP